MASFFVEHKNKRVKHHMVTYLQKRIYHQVWIMGELVVVQKAYWVPSMEKDSHHMNPKMPNQFPVTTLLVQANFHFPVL